MVSATRPQIVLSLLRCSIAAIAAVILAVVIARDGFHSIDLIVAPVALFLVGEEVRVQKGRRAR